LELFRRPKIVKTRELRIPNYYTQAIDGEFGEFSFNEEKGPDYRGVWRSKAFQIAHDSPMDLEVGTGNGVHFQKHCLNHPHRSLVGVELKYKPLIQTIRGALRQGAKNGRIVRFHAFNLDQLFSPNEVDDIFVHFPDPWTTPRKPKNRVMNPRMLDLFWELQRPGSKLDFKTDSREMYLWALEQIKNSKYKIEFQTLDLHSSPLAQENIVTSFEKIFVAQGIEINFVRLRKE